MLRVMRKKLTPKTIDALPLPNGRRHEVRDEVVQGLMIRVSVTGSKIWYIGVRDNGRVRRIKVGTYPVLSLADAREEGQDILRRIQLGTYDAPPAEPYVPPWQVGAERTRLDLREAGIASVVWATGFRADFSFVDLPVFNGAGAPVHHRGVMPVPGLYVLGLGWLWTWGSGRFSGIAEDARHVVETIAIRHWAVDLSAAPRQKVA